MSNFLRFEIIPNFENEKAFWIAAQCYCFAPKHITTIEYLSIFFTTGACKSKHDLLHHPEIKFVRHLLRDAISKIKREEGKDLWINKSQKNMLKLFHKKLIQFEYGLIRTAYIYK